MDLFDFADHSGLDLLDDTAVVIPGVDLGSHLGLETLFTGDFLHLANLPHVVGQRLFAVAVDPPAHRRHRDDGVGVVGGADEDPVDLVAELIEHIAPVGERLNVGEFLFGGG